MSGSSRSGSLSTSYLKILVGHGQTAARRLRRPALSALVAFTKCVTRLSEGCCAYGPRASSVMNQLPDRYASAFSLPFSSELQLMLALEVQKQATCLSVCLTRELSDQLLLTACWAAIDLRTITEWRFRGPLHLLTSSPEPLRVFTPMMRVICISIQRDNAG